MHPVSWAVVLVVINTPLYVLLGKFFFGTLEVFRSALRFRPTPGFAFLFRGELRPEWRAELKLALFMIACAAAVYGEYLGIQAIARR
ncbi:MAG: hypothetical protein ACM3NF_06165 [Gemmatimonadota bacterium]